MDERKREGREGQSEQVREGWMEGWMGKRKREREQRDALVRHAMLGWNQVRPT